MNIAETYTEHRDRYYAWMFERQRIWYKRYMEKSKPPFSDDPIMVRNRFTNTYRELDRGTKYALEVVLPNRDEDSFWQKFMRTLAYRLFNKVATYDKVFRPLGFYDTPTWGIGSVAWDNVKIKLQELHDSGEAIFTRAHVIPTFGAIAANDERKSDKIVDFLQATEQINKDNLMTLVGMNFESAHKNLMKTEHLGDFLAYEILSDLAYTDWVKFDENQWANAGPGALAGLRLIYPNETHTGKRPLELMTELRDQQDLMFASLGLPLYLYIGPGVFNPRLTLRNIEGGLCEYFKYNSCVNGKSRLPFRVGEGYAWK